MVRLIMGEKGTGKTKKLIEMINTTAQEDNGSVVCVEAKSTMTFDLHYHVRLISAYEYDLSNYEALRGFLFGLYAGNYDISHIFIDNLFKITGGECSSASATPPASSSPSPSPATPPLPPTACRSICKFYLCKNKKNASEEAFFFLC